MKKYPSLSTIFHTILYSCLGIATLLVVFEVGFIRLSPHSTLRVIEKPAGMVVTLQQPLITFTTISTQIQNNGNKPVFHATLLLRDAKNNSDKQIIIPYKINPHDSIKYTITLKNASSYVVSLARISYWNGEKIVADQTTIAVDKSVLGQKTKRIQLVQAQPQPKITPPWGVARQIDEHTWTIKVGNDASMANSSEIFQALNSYRQAKGKSILSWDANLAAYAQTRADYFASIHNLDGHKGFSDYAKNPDNYKKLGYYSLGENSAIGYTMSGTHLIEWIYAGDSDHDSLQLGNWSYVGIGVNGTANDLIFGINRM